MIVFRQADPRYPLLWSSARQPPGRWHGPGEGPAHYFADTPDGAWAELLRHEEITTAEDAATLRRALWAVDVGEAEGERVRLPHAALHGGPESWPRCQAAARRARARGVLRLQASAAALLPGGASGWRVEAGRTTRSSARDGRVIVSFESADAFLAWPVVDAGAPPTHVLQHVRHLPTHTQA